MLKRYHDSTASSGFASNKRSTSRANSSVPLPFAVMMPPSATAWASTEVLRALVVRGALPHELHRVARAGSVVEEPVLGQKRRRVADAAHERPLVERALHQGKDVVVASVEPRLSSDEQQRVEALGRLGHRAVGQHGQPSHRADRLAVGGDGSHRAGVFGPAELGAHVGALPVGESVEHVDEHGLLGLLHVGSFP